MTSILLGAGMTLKSGVFLAATIASRAPCSMTVKPAMARPTACIKARTAPGSPWRYSTRPRGKRCARSSPNPVCRTVRLRSDCDGVSANRPKKSWKRPSPGGQRRCGWASCAEPAWRLSRWRSRPGRVRRRDTRRSREPSTPTGGSLRLGARGRLETLSLPVRFGPEAASRPPPRSFHASVSTPTRSWPGWASTRRSGPSSQTMESSRPRTPSSISACRRGGA